MSRTSLSTALEPLPSHTWTTVARWKMYSINFTYGDEKVAVSVETIAKSEESLGRKYYTCAPRLAHLLGAILQVVLIDAETIHPKALLLFLVAQELQDLIDAFSN